MEFTFLVLFATGTTQSYGVARKEYFRRFPRLLGRERADASAGAWVPRAQVEQADAAYVHLRSTASIAEEDDVYEVEAVLDARRARKGGMEYLIQWKGYDATASTWESATDVSDALIAQYHGAQGAIGDTCAVVDELSEYEKLRKARIDSGWHEAVLACEYGIFL